MPNFHDFRVSSLDGPEQSLADYAGKALLVVNVASKCGLTPQYEGLEALHERLAERGFSVLGFPCNQFADQEPGTAEEIRTFCSTTYGVTFPLFSKVDVNGPSADPLWAWLTSVDAQPEGAGDVKWNFGKFLIGPDGAVRARFDPSTTPDDADLLAAIESALS